MRKLSRMEIVALGGLVCTGLSGAAKSQVSAAHLPNAANNAASVRTNQSLVGAAAGTGTQQGQSVATVSGKGQPKIGVGVGSGKVNHFGSKGSVSIANNARLVGVDGAGGPNSANSVSVRNPSQKPVLSGATAAAGNLPK